MSDMKDKWGFIDRKKRGEQLQIWLGVEPCESEAQGNARAAELQDADPDHEYIASKFLPLPAHIRRK
jgi:hypothetical protein